MKYTLSFLLIINILFINFSFAEKTQSNKTYIIKDKKLESKDLKKKDRKLEYEPYEIYFGGDRYLSSYTSSKFLSNIYYGYDYLFTYLYGFIPDNTNTLIFKRLSITYFNMEFAKLVTLLNHEWFGHGFRLREFGIKQKYAILPYGYHFVGYGIPFFYGLSITGYAVPKDINNINQRKDEFSKEELLQKEITIWLGGLEAEDVLRTQTLSNCLSNKYMNSKDAWFYLKSFFSKKSYIGNSHQSPIPDQAYLKDINELAEKGPLKIMRNGGFNKLHDVNNYVKKLCIFYDNDYAITTDELKKFNLLELIDPFFYFSMYQIWNYLIFGNTRLNYPMIPIWKISYLPAYKLIMTPYGLENQIINYFRCYNVSGRFLVNFGGVEVANKKYWGIGLDLNLIKINKCVNLGGNIYLWNQPELFKDPKKSKNKYGTLVNISSRFNIIRHLSLDFNIGYKTKGYIQGHMLDRGVIIGAGLIYHPFMEAENKGK